MSRYKLTPQQRRARIQTIAAQRKAISQPRRTQVVTETQNQSQTPIQRAGKFAKGFAHTIGDVSSNVLIGAIKSLEGIYDVAAGAVGAVGGIFSDDFKEEVKEHIAFDATGTWVGNPLNESLSESWLDNGKVGQIVESVAQGVGQMLPTVFITVATAGAGAPAAISQTTGLIQLGTSAAGNSTEEAYNDGSDYYEGIGYGAASGAVEVATEKMFGGVTKALTGAGILDGITTSVADTGIKRIAKNALEEGAEEIVSELASPALKSIYKGSEAFSEYKTGEYWKGVGNAGLVGSLTALAYSGSIGYGMSKAGIGYTGKEADVSDSLGEISSLRERAIALQGEDALDEATERKIAEATKKNYQNIESVLKSVSEPRRAELIEKFSLKKAFNADGTMSEQLSFWFNSGTEENGTSAPFVNSQKTSYSFSLRGNEAIIRSDLERLSENRVQSYLEERQARGENITIEQARKAVGRLSVLTSDMSDKAQAARRKFNKVLNALNKLSGLNTSFVITEANDTFDGSLVDNERMYISADAFENDMWVQTVVHEYTHLEEGSEEYAKMVDFLQSDDVLADVEIDGAIKRIPLWQKAQADVLGKDYGFDEDIIKVISEKVKAQIGLTLQEAKLYKAFLNEVTAHETQYLLGTESFIDKIVAADHSFALKTIDRILNLKEAFEKVKDKVTDAQLKILHKAEKLYLSAARKAGDTRLVKYILGRSTEFEEKVDSDAQIVYNKKGSYKQIPKQEYAIISHGIMEDNSRFMARNEELPRYGTARSANYFYIYENFTPGNFGVLKQIKITDTNREYIASIEAQIGESNDKQTIGSTSELNRVLEVFKTRTGRNRGNNAHDSGGRANSDNGGVSLGESASDGIGHPQKSNRNKRGVIPALKYAHDADSDAQIVYNKKYKRNHTYYNQYNTMAMQWAFSSKTKTGDIKVLYNPQDNTWNKLVADDTKERYRTLLSIKDTPENTEAIENLYDEVYNEDHREGQRDSESVRKDHARYWGPSNDRGDDNFNVEERNANGRSRKVHGGESQSDRSGDSRQSTRNSGGVNFALKDITEVDSDTQIVYNRKQSHRYISHEKAGDDEVSHINSELQKIYGNDDGIADGIAIEYGSDVYIVDSNRKHDSITFEIQRRKKISDVNVRSELIRRINNDAISKGSVSDGLSSKIGSGLGSDLGRYMRRESRGELQTDSREPRNNQDRVPGNNANNGRLSDSDIRFKLRHAEAEITKSESDLAKSRADYWREKYDTTTKQAKIKGHILSKVQKINELKSGAYVNASQYKTDIFKSSLERLSRIQFRGNMNVSGTRDIIRNLNEWYDANENALYSGVSTEIGAGGRFNNDIKSMMTAIANEKGVLSTDELICLEKIVSYFAGEIETYNTILKNGKRVEALPIAKTYIEKAKLVNDIHLKSGVFRAIIRNKYAITVSDPATLMRQADCYTNGFFSDMFDELRHGEIRSTVTEMELTQEFRSFWEESNSYIKRYGNATIEVNGRKLPIGTAISLYMTYKRKHAQAGLVLSGFDILDNEKKITLDKGINEDLTESQIREIATRRANELYSKFTDSDKKLISIMESAFEKCRELKIETDMALQHYTNVDNSEYYFPIVRSQTAKSLDMLSVFESDRVATLSMNKNTVKGAKNALLIEPAHIVFMRHIKATSMYSGLGIFADNFNRLFNLNVNGIQEKPLSHAAQSNVFVNTEHQKTNNNRPVTLKSTLEADSFTKSMTDYFVEMKKDIDGISTKEQSTRFFNDTVRFIRSTYAKYQLGANPKVWFTQLSSFFAASSILDYSSIVKGLGIKDKYTEVDKYCKLAWLRNIDSTAVKAQAVTDKIDKLSDFLMKPIGKVDRAVIASLFGACQIQVEKDQKLILGTKENKKAAGKLLETVILETQQNSLSSERSAAMRSDNDLLKSFTMFSADALKVFSRVVDAFGEREVIKYFIKNEKSTDKKSIYTARLNDVNKRCVRSISSLVMASTFTALIALAFKRWYRKDGDENFPSFCADVFGNMIGGIPFIRDIYSFFADGYEMESFMTSTFNNVLASSLDSLTLINNAASGKDVSEQEIAVAIRKSFYAAGQITGIPVRNVYNFISGNINRFFPSAGYRLDRTFYEKSYEADLAKAIEHGDDDMISTISGLILNENIGDIENESTRKEINRLTAKGHDVIPRSVGDTLTYNGQIYTLTATQKKAFKKIYAIANKSLTELISLSQYKNASDEVRALAIKFIFDTYYDLALQNRIGGEFENKTVLFAEAIDIEKLALISATASCIKADTDKYGNTIVGSKKKKLQAYIEALRIKSAKKYILMGFLGYRNINGEEQVKAYINTLRLTKQEKSRLLEYSGYSAT